MGEGAREGCRKRSRAGIIKENARRKGSRKLPETKITESCCGKGTRRPY